jgi:hypothetical protein
MHQTAARPSRAAIVSGIEMPVPPATFADLIMLRCATSVE